MKARITGALVLACVATSTLAAPFAEKIPFTQPDGTAIVLFGEGDEFYAVFESLDGYTVVFNQPTKAYDYAQLAADGSALVSSGLEVGRGDPSTLGVDKHVRISPAARKKQAQERFQTWDQGMQVTARWNQIKSAWQQATRDIKDGPELAPPSFTTTGAKTGLTLLIDFSDNPATIPQATMINYCNGDSFTDYGNNGSVKKYYFDNSNGQLTYSNVVTLYIRAPQPKTYYNDTAVDCGVEGRKLITEAINTLKALPNYATEILPTFAGLTVDGSSRVVACNVFYAGANSGVWSYGLWPHSWSLSSALDLGNGKYVYKYQITNIGTAPSLGTFCHENGHMLCGFPDIYDYGYDSEGGAGSFCLMGYHGSYNPQHVCAYLKRAAGWATTINLTRDSNLTASVSASGAGFNTFYRFAKPGVATEYFLIENRQKTGRDASLPAAGVAIWHIDELGNRDNQSTNFNSSHLNYEVSLMQADNLWHFQRYVNSGDANDLYYSGNTAVGYSNRFNDASAPHARWWDGTISEVNLRDFSANAATMTFVVAPPPVLRLTPTDSAVFAGPTGGPFTPSHDEVYTLTNTTPAPLTWSITHAQAWLDVQPTNGTLAAYASAGLTVTINAQANSLATGNYADVLSFFDSMDVGAETRLVQLSVQGVASMPFSETFESGTFQPCWTVSGTSTYRSQVTTANTPHGGAYHLTMDSSLDYGYARNEVTLGINLAGYTNVVLSFWSKSFGDEAHGPPTSPFTQGADFDGVAISRDGVTWYEVQGLRSLGSSYAQTVVDLDAAIAAHGWSYNATFRIRFNQYDNYTIPTDGLAIDDITITGTLAYPPITVTVPADTTEGDGVRSAEGTVTLSRVPTNDVSVTLTSSDTSEVTVPLSLTIPAGQTNATFDVTIADDADLDGTQTATITCSVPGYTTGTGTVKVNDNETALLGVSLPANTAEGVGSVQGRVIVSAPVGAAVTIGLRSSDTTELSVPNTVTVPAGQTGVVFNVTAVNDTQIDGPQTVWLTAHVQNWTAGSNVITVLDNENTNLTLTLTATSYEGQVFTNGGRVAISGTLAGNLAVLLLSSNTSEVQIPNTVTILAGQTSAVFNVTLPVDGLMDGTQAVTVTANAEGFVSAAALIEVLDRDVHHLGLSAIASPQSAGAPFNLTLAAQDINGATITVYQGAVRLSGAGDHVAVSLQPTNAVLVNGLWSGSIRIETVDSNVRLTVDDGLGHSTTSAPFDVQVGPLDHFAWAGIASPQCVDVPFPVTVTAKDAANNTVPGFCGSVAIGGLVGNWINRIMFADVGYYGGSWGLTATCGNRFQPARNITVTHARHFWGNKVSIWTDSGTLVASTSFARADGSWRETPFDTPVTLASGTVYRVAGTTSGACFYCDPAGMPTDFPDGVILSGVASSGDTFPTGMSTSRYLVDLRYTAADFKPADILPVQPGNFVEGVWSCSVTVCTMSSNLCLFAKDSGGHSGTSGVFVALAVSDLSVDLSESQSRGTVGRNLTYRIGVFNGGQSRVGDVSVTDILPATVVFVSAGASQGSLTNTGGAVSWDVGIVSNACSAWATVVVAPTLGGTFTNSVVLTAKVTDPNPNNNSASAVATVTGCGVLAVTPDMDLSARGFAGGPFAPSIQTYTLTNSGTDTLMWQATSRTSWASLSATGGTLPARAATTVTVSLNANAGLLPAGSYADTVTFSNLTTAVGSTARDVSLTVLRGGLLQTTFASNNGYAGSMFDIVPKQNLEITALDVNISPIGITSAVTVFYRLGSSFGHEGNSSDWTLLGTRTVTAASLDLPTYLDISGNSVEFLRGKTYGIYVSVDYASGATLHYTKGSNTYENASLRLISNCGMGDPPFIGGSFSTRTWNGALYYDTALVEDLDVNPVDGLSAQGPGGGPFNPAGKLFTLTNRGENSLTWAGSSPSNWISVVPGNGALLSGASNTITVAINTNAQTLAIGTYTATVAFSNAASSVVQTQEVVLTVWSTNLTVTLPPTGCEGQVFTNGGGVAIGGALTNNLTVCLSSSDTDAVHVPPQVTIAAGQTNAPFDIRLINDSTASGTQVVTVTASAFRFAQGAAAITVMDDDIATHATVIAAFDLATKPNWSCEGQWQFGAPTGKGGTVFANPDPLGGFTGTNVFGVNLHGDYSTDSGGPYCLTAGPLDFTGYRRVTLQFRRWLNTDLDPFVRVAIEISTNGTAWSTAWSNGQQGYYESAWRLVECPLTTADHAPRFFIRWSYQVGPEAFAASGWNLDDIVFMGEPAAGQKTSHGTPVAWLQSYGLTNFNGEVEDLLDVDGDGKLAWEEYVCDTVPTNPASVLALLGVSFGISGVELQWKGGVASTQYLERKNSLYPPEAPWSILFTNNPPTGITNSVLDAVRTNAVRFYRVRAVR